MYTVGGVHCRGCLHHNVVLLGALCTLQGVPTPLLVLLGVETVLKFTVVGFTFLEFRFRQAFYRKY